jgi:hypothetical protein
MQFSNSKLSLAAFLTILTLSITALLIFFLRENNNLKHNTLNPGNIPDTSSFPDDIKVNFPDKKVLALEILSIRIEEIQSSDRDGSNIQLSLKDNTDLSEPPCNNQPLVGGAKISNNKIFILVRGAPYVCDPKLNELFTVTLTKPLSEYSLFIKKEGDNITDQYELIINNEKISITPTKPPTFTIIKNNQLTQTRQYPPTPDTLVTTPLITKQLYVKCKTTPNGNIWSPFKNPNYPSKAIKELQLDCSTPEGVTKTIIENIRKEFAPLLLGENYSLQLLADSSQLLNKVFLRSVRVASGDPRGEVIEYNLHSGIAKYLPTASAYWDHFQARVSPDGSRFIVPVLPEKQSLYNNRDVRIIDMEQDSAKTETIIKEQNLNLFYSCDMDCNWRARWIDNKTISYDVFTLFSKDLNGRLIYPSFIETRFLLVL